MPLADTTHKTVTMSQGCARACAESWRPSTQGVGPWAVAQARGQDLLSSRVQSPGDGLCFLFRLRTDFEL